jgi:hypothetical protein
MLLPSNILPFISHTIRKSLHSLPMILVVLPHSYISCPIFVLLCSDSIQLPIKVFSFYGIVIVLIFSFSVIFIVLPLSFVFYSIRRLIYAVSLPVISDPFSVVIRAIFFLNTASNFNFIRNGIFFLLYTFIRFLKLFVVFFTFEWSFEYWLNFHCCVVAFYLFIECLLIVELFCSLGFFYLFNGILNN